MEEVRREFAELEEPFQRYTLLLQLAAYAPQLPCSFADEAVSYTHLDVYKRQGETAPEWGEGSPVQETD